MTKATCCLHLRTSVSCCGARAASSTVRNHRVSPILNRHAYQQNPELRAAASNFRSLTNKVDVTMQCWSDLGHDVLGLITETRREDANDATLLSLRSAGVPMLELCKSHSAEARRDDVLFQYHGISSPGWRWLEARLSSPSSAVHARLRSRQASWTS